MNNTTTILTHFTNDDDTGGAHSWEDQRELISCETFQIIETVVFCGLTPLLFAIGLPTNILNCMVFYRQGLRDRMNFCLFSLALVDLCFVANFFAFGSFCLVGVVRPILKDWWKWNVRMALFGLNGSFMLSSGCVTAIVAVERCACVVWPMKVPTLATKRSIVLITWGSVLIVNLICWVDYLKFKLGSTSDPITGKEIPIIIPSDMYTQNKTFFDFFENVVTSGLSIAIFTIVCVTTSVTALQLRRAIGWRKGASGNNTIDRRQRSLIKMLIVVSCIYIITAFPNIPLDMISLTVDGFEFTGRYARLFEACVITYVTLAMANSSSNFFVYVTRSSKFRRQLKALFLLDKKVACTLETITSEIRLDSLVKEQNTCKY